MTTPREAVLYLGVCFILAGTAGWLHTRRLAQLQRRELIIGDDAVFRSPGGSDVRKQSLGSDPRTTILEPSETDTITTPSPTFQNPPDCKRSKHLLANSEADENTTVTILFWGMIALVVLLCLCFGVWLKRKLDQKCEHTEVSKAAITAVDASARLGEPVIGREYRRASEATVMDAETKLTHRISQLETMLRENKVNIARTSSRVWGISARLFAAENAVSEHNRQYGELAQEHERLVRAHDNLVRGYDTAIERLKAVEDVETLGIADEPNDESRKGLSRTPPQASDLAKSPRPTTDDQIAPADAGARAMAFHLRPKIPAASSTIGDHVAPEIQPARPIRQLGDSATTSATVQTAAFSHVAGDPAASDRQPTTPMLARAYSIRAIPSHSAAPPIRSTAETKERLCRPDCASNVLFGGEDCSAVEDGLHRPCKRALTCEKRQRKGCCLLDVGRDRRHFTLHTRLPSTSE